MTARRFSSTLTGSHAPYASSSACSSVNVFLAEARRASAAPRRSCSHMDSQRTDVIINRTIDGRRTEKKMFLGRRNIYTLGSRGKLGCDCRLHVLQLLLACCLRLCRSIEAILHLGAGRQVRQFDSHRTDVQTRHGREEHSMFVGVLGVGEQSNRHS